MTKKNRVFGVGIIGCGLIGQKRANALSSGGKLIACADIVIDRATTLANRFNAKSCKDWRDLIAMSEIDIVIICTLHDSLAEITLAAIEARKHVLVEKPVARNTKELEPLIVAAEHCGVLVRVGLNHRFHRAFRKAREIFESGVLGELMFVRARYGHGGRLGYDREWRANPLLSGGGELIDQGPHLIDLSRWFLGDFISIKGVAQTCYWDMPVDDNAFLLLQTAQQKVAFLHVSSTEWKNLFSMEIYGRNGKLEIAGLGGSYGLERLTYFKMLPQMGPPETTSWEFPMGDDSWEVELSEFYNDVRLGRNPSAGLREAYEALRIVELIYKESGYDNCA